MLCWLLKRNTVFYLKYSDTTGLPRRSLKTRDKSAARAICAAENSRLTLGNYGIIQPVVRKVRYMQLVNEYLQLKRDKGRRPETIAGLSAAFNNFGASIKNPLCGKISAAQVQSFEAERRAAGRLPKTIRNELVSLKSLFAFAAVKHYVKENPLAAYQLPPKPRRTPRNIRSDEYLALVGGITDEAFRDVIDFYFLTGLRRGEGTELLVSEHLDMQHGEIRVRDFKEDSERVIYITRALRPIVQRMVARARVRKDDRLIPWTPDALTRRFANLRKRLKMPDSLKLHGTRHTVATELARSGEDIFTVQQFLGHADPESTKVYVNPFKANVRRAAEGLRLPKQARKKQRRKQKKD